MIRRLLAAVLFTSALCATPAAAVVFPFTFDLNSTSFTPTAYGNSKTYALTSSVTTGTGKNKVTKTDTLNMRASAWTWNSATGLITSAALGSYKPSSGADTGGLYVINQYEGYGENNTHAIDNQYHRDFILFQFDDNVQLTGVTANAFSLAGSTDNDLTVGRSVTPIGNAWNSAPNWNGMDVDNIDTLFQAQKHVSSSAGNTLDANRVLYPAGTTGVTGKVWMISASLKNPDSKIDAFKLDNLKVQTNSEHKITQIFGAIPEPATWATMISGFGLIGAAMRRRRTMASARLIW